MLNFIVFKNLIEKLKMCIYIITLYLLFIDPQHVHTK